MTELVAKQNEMFPERLSQKEEDRRNELESFVVENLKTFLEVGMALAEINQDRLYRSTHGDFESYCRDIFEMSRQRAHQLIDAAGVVNQMSTMVDKQATVLPWNERQVRPLLPYKDDPEKLVSVWEEAVKTAPEKKVTAKHVQATIFEITGEQLKKATGRARDEAKSRGELIGNDFETAFDALMKAIERARNGKYKETSREAALRLLDSARAILAEDGSYIKDPVIEE